MLTKQNEFRDKTGLDPKELPELLSQIAEMKNLNLKGLMCIASNTDDRKIIENEFDRMKAWFDTYSRMYPSMDTLSMGMSSDYPVAIEHGSNQIRVGTALFA